MSRIAYPYDVPDGLARYPCHCYTQTLRMHPNLPHIRHPPSAVASSKNILLVDDVGMGAPFNVDDDAIPSSRERSIVGKRVEQLAVHRLPSQAFVYATDHSHFKYHSSVRAQCEV